MKGDLQTGVCFGRWVVQQQLPAFWEEAPARYSVHKTGSLHSPGLVPKAWASPWRAPGLQSTLDSQRNWSLLSVRDGGKAGGGSREDVITCKKRRQASKQWLFPGVSLYPGHIWKAFLSSKKKKIPTQTYPETLLLVDSRSNQVNNQVP